MNNNDSRLAVKVGAFVVACLVVFGGMLLLFNKRGDPFSRAYEIRLRAKTVGGLSPRSDVLLSGVRIGKVAGADVAPEGHGVIVRLEIQERYKIGADARFAIEQLGLLGDQFVAVYPRSQGGRTLQPGDEAVCDEPFSLQDVVQSASSLARRMDQMVSNVNQIVLRVDQAVFTPETLSNAVAAVSNFRQASEKAGKMLDTVDHLIETNAPSLTLSFSNLVRFSAEMDKLAVEFQQMVITNRESLVAAVKNLESVSGMLDRLAGDVQAGRGVAGAIFKDEALQASFSNALVNLATASSNIANYGLLFKPKKPAPPPRPGKDAVTPRRGS